MQEQENEKQSWDYSQARTELRPYRAIYELDAEEKQTLQDFLNGEQVEINCELNDNEDYAVPYLLNGETKVARISSCITINGVRWHLQPGKNIVPRPVYEFMMQAKTAAERMPAPRPGIARNILGDQLFKTRFA